MSPVLFNNQIYKKMKEKHCRVGPVQPKINVNIEFQAHMLSRFPLRVQLIFFNSTTSLVIHSNLLRACFKKKIVVLSKLNIISFAQIICDAKQNKLFVNLGH